MALNRKEFITTASLAFTALAGKSLSSEKLKSCKSVKLEAVHLKASLLEKFFLIKQAGFDAVEVNSRGYNRREILFASEKTDLPIASVYHSDNWVRSISSIDEKERQVAVKSVLNSISIAESYEAGFIHLIPGAVDVDKPEGSQKSLLKSLQVILRRLKNVKLKVLVQNFPSLFFNDPKYFSKIFESLKSDNLGICLDSDALNSGKPLSEWAELLQEYPSKLDVVSQSLSGPVFLSDSFAKVNIISMNFVGGASPGWFIDSKKDLC